MGQNLEGSGGDSEIGRPKVGVGPWTSAAEENVQAWPELA